jgi:hypothetical protein
MPNPSEESDDDACCAGEHGEPSIPSEYPPTLELIEVRTVRSRAEQNVGCHPHPHHTDNESENQRNQGELTGYPENVKQVARWSRLKRAVRAPTLAWDRARVVPSSVVGFRHLMGRRRSSLPPHSGGSVVRTGVRRRFRRLGVDGCRWLACRAIPVCIHRPIVPGRRHSTRPMIRQMPTKITRELRGLRWPAGLPGDLPVPHASGPDDLAREARCQARFS